MVTDYDCWHDEHKSVTTASVLEVLEQNVEHARSLAAAAVPLVAALPAPCANGCDTALEHAIATAADHRDPEMVHRLAAVAGRVTGKSGWS
jgi:5'-methylthioadenosine phosphorylase